MRGEFVTYVGDPQWRALLGTLDISAAPFFLVDDASTSLGSPQPVLAEVASQLRDGTLVRWISDGNRTLTFTVAIVGTTTQQLAEAEQELRLAADPMGTTFALSSVDGVAPDAVFEAETVDLAPTTLGFTLGVLERHLVRAYILTLTCLPYVRSAQATVFEALDAGGGSETTIADGTSATGWTSTLGSVTAGSGVLTVPASATMPGSSWKTPVSWSTNFKRTHSSENFSSTPYVYLDFEDRYSYGAYSETMNAQGDLLVNGVLADFVSSYGHYASSTFFRRLVYKVPSSVASAVTTLEWRLSGEFYLRPIPGEPTGTLSSVSFDNVKRGPYPPLLSTNLQQLRTINVPGSQRTPCSLKMSSNNDLGDVLIYSSPTLGVNGYMPPLRRFAPDSTTTDAAAISGASSTTFKPEIPAGMLPPGTYAFVAAVVGDSLPSTIKIPWSVASSGGGATQSGTTDWALPDGDATTAIVPVAMLSLPPLRGADITTDTVTITCSSATNVGYDEGWLFHLGDPLTGAFDGRVSWLRNVSEQAWINAPDLSTQGAVEAWTAGSTGNNKRWCGDDGVLSDGHLMVPPTTSIFTVNTTGGRASVSGSLFARWLQWPAK